MLVEFMGAAGRRVAVQANADTVEVQETEIGCTVTMTRGASVHTSHLKATYDDVFRKLNAAEEAHVDLIATRILTGQTAGAYESRVADRVFALLLPKLEARVRDAGSKIESDVRAMIEEALGEVDTEQPKKAKAKPGTGK